MTKHTKGPWAYSRGNGFLVFADRPARRLECHGIAKIEWPEMPDAEANARLIAAAPEMLEALREAVDAFSIEVAIADPTIAKMRAIIAKAEGRT